MIVEEKYEMTREVNKRGTVSTTEEVYDYKVVDITEAPKYFIDNEFIQKGYRINFTNIKVILKSLFMVHNELINVWSHLLGALLILILVIHTAVYIKSHKNEIYEILDNKWDSFNDEMRTMASPLIEKYDSFSLEDSITGYVGDLKNRTVGYFNDLEGRLDYYRQMLDERVRCTECIQLLMEKMAKVKNVFNENIEEFKHRVGNDLKKIYNKLDDFDMRRYLDEVNEKLLKFREEVLQKVRI
jgi:hypothetical protein